MKEAVITRLLHNTDGDMDDIEVRHLELAGI